MEAWSFLLDWPAVQPAAHSLFTAPLHLARTSVAETTRACLPKDAVRGTRTGLHMIHPPFHKLVAAPSSVLKAVEMQCRFIEPGSIPGKPYMRYLRHNSRCCVFRPSGWMCKNGSCMDDRRRSLLIATCVFSRAPKSIAFACVALSLATEPTNLP